MSAASQHSTCSAHIMCTRTQLRMWHVLMPFAASTLGYDFLHMIPCSLWPAGTIAPVDRLTRIFLTGVPEPCLMTTEPIAASWVKACQRLWQHSVHRLHAAEEQQRAVARVSMQPGYFVVQRIQQTGCRALVRRYTCAPGPYIC